MDMMSSLYDLNSAPNGSSEEDLFSEEPFTELVETDLPFPPLNYRIKQIIDEREIDLGKY